MEPLVDRASDWRCIVIAIEATPERDNGESLEGYARRLADWFARDEARSAAAIAMLDIEVNLTVPLRLVGRVVEVEAVFDDGQRLTKQRGTGETITEAIGVLCAACVIAERLAHEPETAP